MPIVTKEGIDFTSIQNTAICFLHIDPIPQTDNFGFLVYHPFYNSIYLSTYDPKTDKMDQFTCFDEVKYPLWVKDMENRIKSFNNIYQIFTAMNSAYLMNFLRLTYQYFNNDKKELAKALRYCWSYQEFPNWTERGKALLTVKKLFRITKGYFMEPEEQEYYDNLPDIITVYRGQSHDSKYYNALSWTDDYKKAVWFSKRFGSGHLYQATIEKKYVYAYNNERGESEIILDYTKLKDLKEIQK